MATKKDLIRMMKYMPDDKVIVIADSQGGWCNIDRVIEKDCTIQLMMEETPIFSEGE